MAKLMASALAGLAAGIFLAAGPVAAADNSFAMGGATYKVRVTSLKEARFKSVVPQQYDFSCGSAAVATLLTYHYRRPTNEQQAFEAMFRVGDKQAIQRYGFSLFDMKKYLETLGLKADGFRIPLDELVKVGIPAITLLDVKGYRHFVVIKGIRDGEVLVGDPALGLRAIDRAEFEKMWGGILFVIRDDLKLAQSGFNGEGDWSMRRKAPFAMAISRQGLSTYSLLMPGGFNEF